MWKSGSTPYQTSSSPNRCWAASEFTEFMKRLKWLSRAPFGRPVVPEVYMMQAKSCSVTSTPGAVSSAAATASA